MGMGELNLRLRNNKNAKAIMEKAKYLVLRPKEVRGKWNALFGNHHPIYIEIGIGKGKFILENAIRYPEINFIGIEKFDSILSKSVQLIDQHELSNLKLIRMDAEEIEEIFDSEISRIYLNFSDPWPKDKHAKRRLTSSLFLKRYAKIFVDDMVIIQKTDNAMLYEYSADRYIENGYSIHVESYNIENMPLENMMTEYESKFLLKGNTIYKIYATKEKK